MIKIAHRGNLYGPNPEMENNPEYLMAAVDAGYQVEVDIWHEYGELYLGHDRPQYLVSRDFIFNLERHAWFHCKNINALAYFSEHLQQMNYFWHQEDQYTLTSRNFVWTYPGNPTTDKSVLVSLGRINPNAGFTGAKPYGVCSDYVAVDWTEEEDELF